MTELMTAKYLQDMQIEEVPSPQVPEQQSYEQPTVAAKPPGALAWICVFLGGMGLIGAMLTLPALLLAPTDIDTSQIRGEGAEAMILMAENSMEIARQFKVVNIVTSGAHLLVASGLLIGGLMTISRLKIGAQLLTWSCIFAIGFEVARFLLQGLQSYLQLSLVKDALMQDSEVTTQMAKTLETGIMVGLTISLGLGFLFVAGKCILYYVTTDRLQKPEVQASLR